jgi:hypothetical protein
MSLTMINSDTGRFKTMVAFFVLFLMMQGCEGCPPVTLKTVEIRPVVATGTSGMSGSTGWCTSRGDVPPLAPITMGTGEVKVGFDDFFRPGTDPFPCDDIRNAIFRGGVRFDLSQFDEIVSANLLFDTARSISRTGGGPIINETPPISHATTLAMATQAFTSQMLADNEVILPGGPSINIGVTSQARDWVSKSRNNFGFVIFGPRGPVSGMSSMLRDNDVAVSVYGNFRLRIVFNPAKNPRAPQ